MLPLILSMILFASGAAQGAHLAPATSQAWDEYVKSATARMEQRATSDEPFLWVDEAPERLARVRGGEIVVAPMGAQNPKKVPFGLIHDWVGAAFIPNVSLSDVLPVVRDYARFKDWYQPGVADSKVIATGEDADRFSMLLINKSAMLKTAFDADYESSYIQMDQRRVYSISRTTRVQEIEEYGTAAERRLEEGEGHGTIWGLLGITRFQERDGGVYVELEAIGLSRGIPASFRLFVEPIVRRVSRDSLLTSLQQTGKAVRLRAELAHAEHSSGQSIFGSRTGQALH